MNECRSSGRIFLQAGAAGSGINSGAGHTTTLGSEAAHVTRARASDWLLVVPLSLQKPEIRHDYWNRVFFTSVGFLFIFFRLRSFSSSVAVELEIIIQKIGIKILFLFSPGMRGMRKCNEAPLPWQRHTGVVNLQGWFFFFFINKKNISLFQTAPTQSWGAFNVWDLSELTGGVNKVLGVQA